MVKLRGFLYWISYTVFYPMFIILLLLYTPAMKGDRVVFITSGPEIPVLVEIADNPIEHQIGLMNRTSLEKDSGMLFIFGGESVRHFWMKNTLMPLDMIFVNESMEIVHIVRNAQPCRTLICDTYSSEKPAKYVVEVNGGFAERKGIKTGDRIRIEFVK